MFWFFRSEYFAILLFHFVFLDLFVGQYISSLMLNVLTSGFIYYIWEYDCRLCHVKVDDEWVFTEKQVYVWHSCPGTNRDRQPEREHASSDSADKTWLFQVKLSSEDAKRWLSWCHPGPCWSCDTLMLGGTGEAGAGLFSFAEAQQGEGDCNAAISQTNISFLLNFFIHFS